MTWLQAHQAHKNRVLIVKATTVTPQARLFVIHVTTVATTAGPPHQNGLRPSFRVMPPRIIFTFSSDGNQYNVGTPARPGKCIIIHYSCTCSKLAAAHAKFQSVLADGSRFKSFCGERKMKKTVRIIKATQLCWERHAFAFYVNMCWCTARWFHGGKQQ